eukprot:TRINITY_DN115_c0_g1_i1.p1 TRINITY_DN115_c0_g1~~TRINITY_DN115_c0_g1_i1.p1  ORF type:complete len:459 (+),score=98.91 TRINITY_DN115_c0_g1_i1:36-1379(+)
MDSSPTVFVFPPNVSLTCSLHKGVLVDPVTSPCGCSFCSKCITEHLQSSTSCPTHQTPLSSKQLTPNTPLSERIDELLVYCRWGLKPNESGDGWVPSSDGCPLWLCLGARQVHEDKCPFKRKTDNIDDDDDFVMVPCKASPKASPHSTPPSSSPSPLAALVALARPSTPHFQCPHEACSFVGHTDEETRNHLTNSCAYEALARQIGTLIVTLEDKDREISRLHSELRDIRGVLPSPVGPDDFPPDGMTAMIEFAEAVKHIGRQVVQALARDGKFFVQGAKTNLNHAKESGTQALQSSLETLTNLRLAITSLSRSAQLEVGIKVDRLVQTASHLPAEIVEELKELRTAITQNQESRSPPSSPVPSRVSSSSTTTSEPAAETTQAPPNKVEQEEEEVDEDLKRALQFSRETFEQEQAKKAGDEEQELRLAMLDSLMSSMPKTPIDDLTP